MVRKILVLLVLLLLVGTLLSSGVPTYANAVAPSLHFAATPVRFAVDCTMIPLTMLVLRADAGNKASVTEVTLEMDGRATNAIGQWRPLTADAATVLEMRESWSAFSKPGYTTDAEGSAARKVTDMIQGMAGRYDAITVNVPAPVSMKPGSSFAISATAALSDGTLATAETYALAEATTAPSEWVLGDCHMHSATFSDGCLTLPQIRVEAQSYGHSFTYLTDHISSIQPGGIGWQTYYLSCEQESLTAPYVMCPGFEITAANANGVGDYDGDALGFGIQTSVDPDLQDHDFACSEMLSNINSASTTYGTSCIAHPAGTPDWEGGYSVNQKAIQVVDPSSIAESFWRVSMAGGYGSTAIGGSDKHIALQNMNKGTWVYAPNLKTMPVSPYLNRINKVALGIRNGQTSAVVGSSFAYFTINNQLPGRTITASVGSTANVSVRLYPVQNGKWCTMTWQLYRAQTTLIGSGTVDSWDGNPVTRSLSFSVPQGLKGYYLKVRFDYRNTLGGAIQFTDWAYCGPIYMKQ